MGDVSCNLEKLSKSSLINIAEKSYRSVYVNKGFYETIFRQSVTLPLSPENQEKILSATVNNCQVKKYPPPLSFQKFYLKIFLKEVESSGYEVSEELFIAYANTLSESASNDALWYHCYFINETEVITIQENSNLVVKSTTGLTTWEAGKYLTEWCIENSHLFKNRHILELGSGTGLLGITLSKHVEPTAFVFTDKSPDVLRLISSNLQVNLSSTTDSVTSESNDVAFKNSLVYNNILHTSNLLYSSSKISVCHLEWENLSDHQAAMWSPEIILAADVVYDPSMVPHLVHAIHTFLVNGTECAYVAFSVRNNDTYACFRSHLDNQGLKGEDIAGPQKFHLFYDNISCLKIYKISLSL